MPTGYTAAVADGISFEQFVLCCARAMGALIMMRDAPSNAPIPGRFEPSTYNAERLVEARAELDRLSALTSDEIAAATAAFNSAAVARQDDSVKRNDDLRAKYEAMLVRVRDWTPPTTEHEGMKKFMIDQLEQSIDWDCGGRAYDAPEPLSPEAWLGQAVREASKNIEYHAKANAEEIERTEQRNKWIADLRASLDQPA